MVYFWYPRPKSKPNSPDSQFRKLGQKTPSGYIAAVQAVARRFEPQPSKVIEHVVQNHRVGSQPNEIEVPIALCAADVRTLVQALYPQHPYGSSSSDVDGARTGSQSSASSVSGFSLFHSPAAAVPLFLPPAFLHDHLAGALYPLISSGDQESLLDTDKVFPDQSGEILREACSSLEDGFPGRAPPGHPDWAIFQFDPLSRQLCTIRDALSKDLKRARAHTRSVVDALEVGSGSYACRSAIREVLLHTTYYQNSPTTEHAHHQVIHASINLGFNIQISDCEDSSDFVAAHTWCRRQEDFGAFVAANPSPESLSTMLSAIGSHNENVIDMALTAAQWCYQPLRDVQVVMDKQQRDLMAYADVVSQLRTKMWYVADVRTSAAYDEARSVAAALKIMGKAKRPRRTRPSPPPRHWNGSKVSSTSFHLKTEAQVLDILSASPDHGGPNKLSDDQARALTTWLDRNCVDNLCPGEERLQRLCMEIRKAVTALTADASTAWSSSLFSRDQLSASALTRHMPSSPLWPHHGYGLRLDPLTLQTNVPPSIDSISSAASHPLSARSSRDYLDTRSPALTNQSSTSFWSPAMTETRSPSSTTSIGSSQTRAPGRHLLHEATTANQASIDILKQDIRQHATSLLLSDLTLTTFANGSETDQAFWSGLGGDLAQKHFRSLHTLLPNGCDNTRRQIFNFDKASGALMRLFTATSNPFTKLRYLCDLDTLMRGHSSAEEADIYDFPSEVLGQRSTGPLAQSNGTSRSSRFKISGFRKLFSDPTKRPPTIFRDLQYIAAFMPPTMTSSTPEGKAFRHAAIALLSIKQEVCRFMVETADSIIDFHSNKRGSGHSSSSAQQERDSATFSVPARTPSAEDIGHYTMAQAAELLQITAKEGDAVAQRELATLYLTHPELMDHIIAPLSRPRDVFKEEMESKWRRNQDPSRCDPATMCVAHHWMSMSSKGGDALAKEYLRQREEMDRLG